MGASGHVGREAGAEVLQLGGVGGPGAEDVSAEAQRVLEGVEALEHDQPGVATGVADVGELH